MQKSVAVFVERQMQVTWWCNGWWWWWWFGNG